MTTTTQITMEKLAEMERTGKFECYEVVLVPNGVVRFGYEPSPTATQGKLHRAYFVSMSK